MKERVMKVYRAPSCDNETPQIRISAKWLKEFGFEVGTQFRVIAENGELRLIKERMVVEG